MPKTKHWARKVLRILCHLLLWPLLLLALLAVLIYVPPVQNLIRSKAVSFLKEKIGTEVRLGHLALRFPIGVTLHELYVEGQNGDTLLYAGAIKARLGLKALTEERILLGGIVLENVRATVRQDADSIFNFQFILDGFVSSDTTAAPKDTTAGWAFGIEDVHLKNIHLDLDLRPTQLAMDLHLGELDVELNKFETDHHRYYVDEFELSDTRMTMRTRSSPPEPNTYPALSNPMDGFDIRFNDLVLNDVSFSMSTMDTGDSLWLDAHELSIIADAMDLTHQQIKLDRIDLNGATFGMLTANKDTLSMAPNDPPWLEQNDGFRYFIRDWDITTKTLSAKKTNFALHNRVVGVPRKLLDPDHFVFENIAVLLNDLAVNNHAINVNISKLNATTGPENTALSAAMRVHATPEMLTLSDGMISAGGNAIQFNTRTEQGSLVKAYRDPQHVPFSLQAHANIDLEQLERLLIALEIPVPNGLTASEELLTNVELRGTLQAIDTFALKLKGDQGSILNVHGRVTDLTEWPLSIFDVQLDELTMGAGIHQAIRVVVPEGTVLPERFTARVLASGNNGTMVANIAIDSDMGKVNGKLGVKDWIENLPDAFDVDLDIDRLRVSVFTGDTTIGPFSGHISATGTQINSPERQAHLEVAPTEMSYQGNDLSSLRVVADARGDSIHAQVKATAEPMDIVLQGHGIWPEKGDSLKARFDLQIATLELEKLGLIAKPLNITGNMNGRVAFAPDGFGSFELIADSLLLANAQRDFQFMKFRAHGLLNADSTAFEIDSDAITLLYHTNLSIDSLIPRSRQKLSSLFAADPSFEAAPGDHMELAITLPRSEWLTGLLVPELQAIQLRNFTGAYDSDLDEIRLNIDMPLFVYDSIRVERFTATINAKGPVLNGEVVVDHIQRDSIYVDGMSIKAVTDEGALKTTLRVQPHDSTVQYLVGVSLSTIDGTRTLHVEKDLVLNWIPWTADTANLLSFGADEMHAENFEMRSEEQRVELRTEPDMVHLLLTKFRLGTVTKLVSTMDSIPLATGIINGDVAIPRNESGLLKADLQIDKLTALGAPIGTLNIHVDQLNGSTYDARAGITDKRNHMEATARFGTGTNPYVRSNADIDLADIGFLKPFVSDLLYALEGGISGKLQYEQQGEQKQMAGALNFNNAKVGVIMTGATYALKNERIVLNNTGIVMKNFTLQDSLGNAFQLNGNIGLANFSNPTLDLTIRTDEFRMVNSTFAQNQFFYGNLIASTDLTLTGTADRPVMKGKIGILPGTDFSVVLPGSQVELVQAEGIVVFTDDLNYTDTLVFNARDQLLRDSLKANLPGVELDLGITISDQALFAMVLDPTTGDQATFRGTGDLTFRYEPDGDMYLNGPFTIEEGGYTLEFYGLVKKRFDLVKGGTIRWNGDPLDATIDVQATYTSESAPYPLVASASSGISEVERNSLQQPLPFNVVIGIAGDISDPRIDFGIDLERGLRNSYPKVSDRLDQLSQSGSTEDRNRQVFGLLVMNSFIQDEGSGGAPSSGIATSAARNSINGLLTDQLNKLSGKYIKGVNLQLGVNTYDQANGNSAYQRTSVDYKVSKSIANDRLSFELGGSIGVNEQNSQVSNVSNTRAAQYAILYDLTEDGRFRIRGFHENAYDLYDGEITNSGIAIMFTKDFEENERARMRQREEERMKNEK